MRYKSIRLCALQSRSFWPMIVFQHKFMISVTGMLRSRIILESNLKTLIHIQHL
jgi:hypothetical protein